ncbi:MAG: hypothetical protein DRO15_07465 [Thermoprotei archaeon]|nr:MAG: hypothetical protein DRO15_07465 [Thermoprotei archaeon]
MKADETIYMLSKGRYIAVSPYIWVNSVLISEVALNLLNRYEIVNLIDLVGFRYEILERIASRRGMVEKLSRIVIGQRIRPLIVFELDENPSFLRNRPIFATASRWLKDFKTYGYKKVSVKRISSLPIFSVECDDFRTLIRITPQGVEDVKIPSQLQRVLHIIEEGLEIYGPFKFRDAIVIISKELKVSRDESRRLLMQLIKQGFIKIVRGGYLECSR